jgi:hypothetical protein
VVRVIQGVAASWLAAVCSARSLSDHKLIITLIRTSFSIFVCLLTIVRLIANQFKALFV